MLHLRLSISRSVAPPRVLLFRPDTAASYPGRTYRFFDGSPVYEFGTGLSYTTWSFEWSAPPSPASQTEATPATTMSVKVTNTGTMDGDQAVLVFAVPPAAGTSGRPLKYLVDFERVSVAAHDATDVSFTIPSSKLLLTDSDGKKMYTPGSWTFQVESLSASVTLA